MLQERFEFRTIDPNNVEEVDHTIYMEDVCMPPGEGCTREEILDRVYAAPEFFLLAVEKETGKIAGYVNGVATNESVIRDEFFSKGGKLHDPDGSTIMLVSLVVMPQYRGLGLGREIMRVYAEREKAKGRKRMILTCVEKNIKMYEKFGYRLLGVSQSVYGGAVWYDMDIFLDEDEETIREARVQSDSDFSKSIDGFEDKFIDLLKQYQDRMDDPIAFNALMNDYFPTNKLQSYLLMALYRMDIVKAIRDATELTEPLTARFEKRLVKDFGVKEAFAKWAVGVWCHCYGELVLSKKNSVPIVIG